jgi:tRNA-dihydrouridine synthase A
MLEGTSCTPSGRDSTLLPPPCDGEDDVHDDRDYQIPTWTTTIPPPSSSHDDGVATIAPRQKELHIAPMLDYSKREFRKLMSILSTRLVLWTDMVVDETIAHSSRLRDILEPDTDLPNRQICQIGGSSPEMCGDATRIVEVVYQYDEINLNLGCPSDRVSNDQAFGAYLMTKADAAVAVVRSMQQNASDGMPVSVKCRVGVDDMDDIEFVAGFVERMLPVCTRFYVHARKCVLSGLYNTKQNRTIPPLLFPRVYELCRRFPQAEFWINGGIRTLTEAKSICHGSTLPCHRPDRHRAVPCESCNLPHGSCMTPPFGAAAPSNLRGCMMGRAAIDNPAIFWDADRYFYGLDENPCRNRRQVLERYCEYLEQLYPRRCCDLDEAITYGIPVPNVHRLCSYCPMCRPMYQKDCNHVGECGETDRLDPRNRGDGGGTKVKVASGLVARALRPVKGLFHGLPKRKIFLQTLDEQVRDLTIRNCGIGFILRRVMAIIPDDLLDRDFVRTEDYKLETTK